MAVVLAELSLEVKAYVQPLGVENEWSDLGEGVVEIEGNMVRVRPLAPPPEIGPEDCGGDAATAAQLTEALQAAGGDEPLLEDELEADTQLVGRDSCIVWNSPSQELSFCIMFATELGYEATNAAFSYLVNQKLEGWTIDLFAEMKEGCAEKPDEFATKLAEELESAEKFGFIERHALVSSFIAGDYAKDPGMIGRSDVCHALLTLHHPEIIEYLIHDDRFNVFAASAEQSMMSPSAAPQPSSSSFQWEVPSKLQKLPMVDTIQQVITRVHRLHALRPRKGPAEANPIVETLESVANRQLSALLIELTTNDDFLRGLGDGLHECCQAGPSEDVECAVQHLRCLANLLDLAASTHGRDAAAPAIVHIMQGCDGLAGLAATAKLLKRRYTNALHAAFCAVLDASLMVLNHKGDEIAMAMLFRDPIVASSNAVGGRPDVLAPFLGYLARCCVTGGPSVVAAPAGGSDSQTSSRAESSEAARSLVNSHRPSRAATPVAAPTAQGAASTAAGGGQENDHGDDDEDGMANLGDIGRSSSIGGAAVEQLSVPQEPGAAAPTATAETPNRATVFTSLASIVPTVNLFASPKQQTQRGRAGSNDSAGAAPSPTAAFPAGSLATRPAAATSNSLRHSPQPPPSAVPGGGVLGHGPHYVFHLLGLHDDEGTTVDRAPTAESVESRAAIQRHFVHAHVYGLLQSCSAAAALPEPVANLLEYIFRLTQPDNRDRLLHLLLSSRCPLVPLLTAHAGGRNKAEVCANLRLLRAMLSAMLALDRKSLLPLANRLTFDNDVWGVFVRRLAGDRRANSMVHCVFNSTLELLATQNTLCPSADPLDPIRRFVVLKYRAALPKRFVADLEAAELGALAKECNADDFRSPVPYMSPSRAASPAAALETSSQRRQRVAEEELPPDRRHAQLSSKLRALVSSRHNSVDSQGSADDGASSAAAGPSELRRGSIHHSDDDDEVEVEEHIEEAARARPVSAGSGTLGAAIATAAAGATNGSSSSATSTTTGRARSQAPPSSLHTAAAAAAGAGPVPPATEPPVNKPRRPVAPVIGKKTGRRLVPLKQPKTL